MVQLQLKKYSKALRNGGIALTFMAAQVMAVVSPFMTSAVNAADTGWNTPTAIHLPNNWDTNAVANAQTSNNVYVSDNDGSEQGYSFSPPAVPAGATINGVEVSAEAKSSDNSGCRLAVALSWNNGTNYTGFQESNLGNSDDTESFGGAADTWGRTWAVGEFTAANFVAKIQDNDPGNQCEDSATTSVDLLQVRVHYTVPVAVTANPVLSSSCGLDIALVLDNSTSIDDGEMTQMKTAVKSFTNALNGTPTEFSLTRFATSATVMEGFTSNVATINTAIDTIPTGGGFTNWEDGLTKAQSTLPNRSNPNLVIFATDGDPTTSNTVGGTDTGQPNAHLDPAIVAANSIKAGGTRVLALGIGLGGGSVDRLKAISGPNADTGNVLTSDVISSNFNTLAADLAAFAQQTCGGTITTKKVIDADGNLDTTNDRTPASNWSFDVNGSPSDPAATVTDASGFTPAVAVSPGTYSVNETQKAGYSLLSASCTGAGNNGSTSGNAVTGVQVAANNIVTCTFINTALRGTITVNKVTNPAGNQTAFPVTASGTGNIAGNATKNVTTTTPAVYDVAQGTYSVSEQAPAGWQQTGNTCSNIAITANNLSASCTITNTKLGSLTIVKDALPNDAQDFKFGVTGLGGGDFYLDDDGNATLSNQKAFTGLLPGQYSVTEQSTPGWKLTSLVCDNSSVQGSTANVTLTAGQNVTCTFTNTKLGSLSGVKYTANANSSLGPVLSGWTIYIDSNNNGQLDNGEQSDVTDQDGAYSFSDLLPDVYVLREVLAAGWTQIFGAGSVNLSSGQNSTGNNFGNFQNGSINGFKWSDKDADGVVDENESKLDGWTITLYDDEDDAIGSVVTANGGLYSFGNLAPGTYGVCETQQSGWAQTYPANNQCHTIVIDQSGESNQANFGNQGRGSIKVVKNVDTDGDGDVDEYGSTDWTWDIDGSGNFATGSTQSISAGEYTISEDQQANYHFVSVSCAEGDYLYKVTQDESFDLAIKAGENVVCTFVNARDTATITVNKEVAPSEDDGEFNLLIDGDVYAANVGDGGTTGEITVLTGTYDVSETASEGTNLDDYTTTNSCTWGQRGGSGTGTSIEGLELAANDNVVCTFTNTKDANVVVTKYNDFNRNGWYDDGEEYTVDEPTLSGWTFNLSGGEYCEEDLVGFLEKSLFEDCYTYDETQTTDETGSTTFTHVKPGISYQLTEEQQDGWYLSNVFCDNYGGSLDGDTYYMSSESIDPGQTVHCYVGNYRDASLVVDKENDKTDAVRTGATITYTLTVSVPEDSGAVFDAVVRDILPEGVTYVPGSWTSTSSATSDPLFDPIGEWEVGDLYPGEAVILTYQATVDSDATPGTYTNTAYGEGCSYQMRGEISLSRVQQIVIDQPGCEEPVTSDFAESDVVVEDEPQVLGASTTKTVLVNTGTDDVMRNMLVGLTLMMMTLALAIATRQQQKSTK